MFPIFTDLCIHYALKFPELSTTEDTNCSDIFFSHYLTKEDFKQGLETLIISDFDKANLLYKRERQYLRGIERDVLYYGFSTVQGKILKLIHMAKLHTFIKESIDKFIQGFSINLGVTEYELHNLIFSAITRENLKALEFGSLLVVEDISFDNFKESSTLEDKCSTIRFWIEQNTRQKLKDEEVLLYNYILSSIKSVLNQYDLTLPVSEDELDDLIAEAIKTKNLKVLELGGLLVVDDYPLSLFKEAKNFEESCFGVKQWLRWGPLIYKLQKLQHPQNSISSRIKDSKKITLNLELEDEKFQELLNEFVEKLKRSSGEWLRVTVE